MHGPAGACKRGSIARLGGGPFTGALSVVRRSRGGAVTLLGYPWGSQSYKNTALRLGAKYTW